MLDSIIRDWLEPSPLHPLRSMSGNMWALHPSIYIYISLELKLGSKHPYIILESLEGTT
jgi:hypothetical protein